MDLFGVPQGAFAPSSARGIFITGVINQDTVDRVTPKILEFREASNSPITVYIDSDGGEVRAARVILSLLKGPQLDGSRCRIITVATGRAFSAAADLLAAGDFSIAYPHAAILCHGTRRFLNSPITTESALNHSENLRQSNESSAFQLAEQCIDRFLLRYLLLNTDAEPGATHFNLSAVTGRLAQRLSSESFSGISEIPSIALERYNRLSQINTYLRPKKQERPGERKAQRQARILKALIDYELKTHKGRDWVLPPNLNTLQEDFAYVDDYFSALHIQHLNKLSEKYQDAFLTQKDLEKCEALEDEKEKADTRRLLCATNIHPIWYFFVSVCRTLQQADYLMNAVDAYWLGLIDEVIGVNLPSARTIYEQFKNTPPETAPAGAETTATSP